MLFMFDAKAFLADVPHLPGVYRMYDAKNTIIYVGKAKDLKKRLSSYFRSQLASKKTEALVANIHHIETTITHSETEALLLEHNYIKENQPKYNVLLRDDKSYPYILLTKHQHPRITSFRGSKKIAGEYFGPYPNAGAVRETLNLLQKLFPILLTQFDRNVSVIARILPFMDNQIKKQVEPMVQAYVKQVTEQNKENPFGVQISRFSWAGNHGIVQEAIITYQLHLLYPDIVKPDLIYRSLDYLFGCHPFHNLSFVSGVGAQPKKVAYGNNRADYSFIPGGVVPGIRIVKPDFPENRDDYPFLWSENEYVIDLAASYIYLVNAADHLLNNSGK